jgi:hypothetical protein
MARPSGQNTMKPSTIKATVAGVQSGRSNADWFIIDYPRFRRGRYAADGNDVGNAPHGFKESVFAIG